MAIQFIGESPDHRRARDQLLAAEIELRDQRERVAALRRELPSNAVETDYVFQEGPRDLEKDDPIHDVKLSGLFGDKDELLLIHFMFDPSWEKGCPMCSMWADTYDAAARHVQKRASFALVAKQQIDAAELALERGIDRVRMSDSAVCFATEDRGAGPLAKGVVLHAEVADEAAVMGR